MSLSDLIECTHKMDELSTEVNQLLEAMAKEIDCMSPCYQQLSIMRQNLASMKIYLNEVLGGLTRRHEIMSRLKHDLGLMLWVSIGTFIGVFCTLHF